MATHIGCFLLFGLSLSTVSVASDITLDNKRFELHEGHAQFICLYEQPNSRWLGGYVPSDEATDCCRYDNGWYKEDHKRE